MTMGRSVAIGATGFTLTTIAAYSVWAFGGRILYRSMGELGLYAVCALVFILFGSFLLRPLTRLRLGKFAAIFTTAFVAYAVAWCAAWFGAKGRTGEWLGSFAGSLAFCVSLAFWFRAGRPVLVSTVILFIAHSAGYFAGSWSFYELREEHASVAKLAWGFFHGLGMGAGLGLVFYQMQKIRTSETTRADGPSPIQPAPR
jgi:hypothetical protein